MLLGWDNLQVAHCAAHPLASFAPCNVTCRLQTLGPRGLAPVKVEQVFTFNASPPVLSPHEFYSGRGLLHEYQAIQARVQELRHPRVQQQLPPQ